MSFGSVASRSDETLVKTTRKTCQWTMKGTALCILARRSAKIPNRFYKCIEDAYTHANRTLLQLLLRDQQLIPRLRSLKRYFFLSQSSFLTHLLDLSHTELRKSAKSASLVKLQSLLDLALNTDAQGEDAMFREDVKVTMAGSGLYEWLLTVVNVSGLEEGEAADGHVHAHESQKKEREKDKDDKKQMLGESAPSGHRNVCRSD